MIASVGSGGYVPEVSPARAGTSAVVAVLAAAGLLLVLVTWAASIGPDRVVSGGHIDRIRPRRADALGHRDRATRRDPVAEEPQQERGDAAGLDPRPSPSSSSC